jgi:hypothetical protein
MAIEGILAILCIFGVPVISWTCVRMFKLWIAHQERKIELLGHSQAPSVDAQSIIELRNDIRRVSDVATNYDMSIQHSLDQIQRRLDFLESKSTIGQSPNRATYSPPVEQVIIIGQDGSSQLDG